MNDDVVRVGRTDLARTARAPRAALVLPPLIVDAGPVAVEKFLEFFAARIANRRTRAAYGRAVGQFLAWCAARGLALEAVAPLHVAAYIRTHPGSAPTVKQHLAALRMLGDWLVVSQVLPVNPAAAVRGPTHVVTTGATPVLAPAEARRLLEAIDTATLAGRRDRALVSVMLYSFARVSAVSGMRRQDYFRQEGRGWLRLHEKGGRRHDVPAHHRAAEALDDYLEAGRSRRADGGALPERRPRGAAADGPGALAASRPGDDQAAGGRGGSPALDLLPHVPGHGDHGVLVERRDARTRAADRRARLPEDHEALRPDGKHDHRRRDRAHRDLGGGRTARRRAPRDGRSARRDGRAARGRGRHGGCRVARTLDSVVRLRLVPPGGWGVSAARRWRAAPTRVGALWQPTRSVRQHRSMFGWPACPGPVFARLDRMYRRYAWLRRACGSRSRIGNPGASGGWSGPCARTATVAVGILRLIGTYGSSSRLRCYPFPEGRIDPERSQRLGGRSATSLPSGPPSFQPGEFEARYDEQAAVALTHLIRPPGFPVRFMSDCWARFFWTNRRDEISDDN